MPPKLQQHIPMGQHVLWGLFDISCKTQRKGARAFSPISGISSSLSWFESDSWKFLILVYALFKYFSNSLYSGELCGDGHMESAEGTAAAGRELTELITKLQTLSCTQMEPQ